VRDPNLETLNLTPKTTDIRGRPRGVFPYDIEKIRALIEVDRIRHVLSQP
jgi:hypothetical protein